MIEILTGDCREMLKTLPEASVQCCVTSPPYWGLRDYGHADQIGLEETPEAYVETMRQVFAEVWRVLRDDGTCWLNLGDSYWGGGNYRGSEASLNSKQGTNRGARGMLAIGRQKKPVTLNFTNAAKPKDLVGIPWRVAFALQADGWYLRSDIIWHKPNPMPESVTDRPTKSHEYIFLLTKKQNYYYDAEAIKEKAETVEDRPWGIQRDAIYDYDSKEKKVRPNKKRGKEHPANSGSNGSTWRGHSGNFDVNGNLIGAGNRNKRSVWSVTNSGYHDAHFATFPPDLIKPCILAGTKPGDTVLDPFGGSGTTGMVALELGRKAILIELNPEYVALINKRTHITPGLKL